MTVEGSENGLRTPEEIRAHIKNELVKAGMPEDIAEQKLKERFDSYRANKPMDPTENWILNILVEFQAETASTGQVKKNSSDSGQVRSHTSIDNNESIQNRKRRAFIKRKLLERKIPAAQAEKLLNQLYDSYTSDSGKNDQGDVWVHTLTRKYEQELDAEIAKDIETGLASTSSGKEYFENPDLITYKDFERLGSTEEGRAGLVYMITQRQDEIKKFQKLYGITLKQELAGLERQGEIEGWTLSETNGDFLRKYLPYLHKVDRTIFNGYFGMWRKFFYSSERLFQTINEHGRDNDLDAKSRPDKISNNDSSVAAPAAVSIAQQPTETFAPVAQTQTETQLQPQAPENLYPVTALSASQEAIDVLPPMAEPQVDEYAWRKGIETFTPDQEYRKGIEDWLDKVYLRIVAEVSESYVGGMALANHEDFKKFLELSKELKSLLAQKELEEKGYGMHRHLTGIEYSDEEKKVIQGNINNLIDLTKSIYDDFNLPMGKKSDQELMASADEAVVGTSAVKEKSEWQVKRVEWKVLQKERDEKFAEYYKNLNDRSRLQKLFGIGKEIPSELTDLETQYKEVRATHAKSLKKALEKRKEARESGDNKTEFTLDNEKVKSAAAGRFIFKEVERNLNLQKAALTSVEQSRFAKALTWWQKQPQLAKYLGTATVGATVGVLTGGVSSVSGLIWRLTGGVATGKLAADAASAGVGKLYDKKIASSGKLIEGQKQSFKQNFDVSNISASVASLRTKEENLNKLYRNKKVYSAVAGMGAAMGAGAVFGNLSAEDGVDAASNALQDSTTPVPVPESPSLDAPKVELSLPSESAPTLTQSEVPSNEVVRGLEAVMPSSQYTVKPGDNLWKIMEGKVEGATISPALEQVPETDRNTVLVELFKHVDEDAKLREAIGMRSLHADRIYINEKLNLEPLNQEIERIVRSLPVEKDLSAFTEGESGFETQGKLAIGETEIASSTDVSEVPTKDEERVANGNVAPNDQRKDVALSESEALGGINDGSRIETLKSTVVARVEAIQKPFLGIFGGEPDVSGTFDKIKNMSLTQIIALQGNLNLVPELEKLEIPIEGWDKWMSEINSMNGIVPANKSETLDQYLGRVVDNQSPKALAA